MLSELVVNELKELQEENQGFTVTDLGSASWCFRKLHALNEQLKEYEALRLAEITRINDWFDSEKGKLENQKMFFTGLLNEYALEQRKANPKFKASTPYGKISFRKQQPKWNYEDETVLKALKRSNMLNCIKTTEEVKKAELKKVCSVVNGKAVIADTGEIIEGITVEEQPEAIKIEVI